MVSEVVASKDERGIYLEYTLRQQTNDRPVRTYFSPQVISGDRVLITLLEGDPDPIDYLIEVIKSSGRIISNNSYLPRS